jgi:hypothetical protein
VIRIPAAKIPIHHPSIFEQEAKVPFSWSNDWLWKGYWWEWYSLPIHFVTAI